MCTRYYIDNSDPILIPIIEEAERSPLYDRFLLEAGRKITTSGEVFPTDITIRDQMVQRLLHHTTVEMTMKYIKDLELNEKLRDNLEYGFDEETES